MKRSNERDPRQLEPDTGQFYMRALAAAVSLSTIRERRDNTDDRKRARTWRPRARARVPPACVPYEVTRDDTPTLNYMYYSLTGKFNNNDNGNNR